MVENLKDNPMGAQNMTEFLECYLDYIENLPNSVQPFISEMKRLDTECFAILSQLDTLKERLKLVISKNCNDCNKKNQIIADIKLCLAHGQFNGDAKLRALETIMEIIETKKFQLGSCARAFEPKAEDTQANTGFGRRHMTSDMLRMRSERPSSSIARSKTTNEKYSGRCSSSIGFERTTSSSSAAKRPRRQKQFPDFIRDADFSVPTANNKRERPAGSSTPNSTTSNDKPIEKKTQTRRTSGVSGKRRRKETTANTSYDIPVDPNEPVYCLCEQVSYGEMIGCDNDNCEIEWFHFKCVGLNNNPKGKWFCPTCRGDKHNIIKPSLANK